MMFFHPLAMVPLWHQKCGVVLWPMLDYQQSSIQTEEVSTFYKLTRFSRTQSSSLLRHLGHDLTNAVKQNKLGYERKVAMCLT